MGLIVVSSIGKGVLKCVLLGSGKFGDFFTSFDNLYFYVWWSALEQSQGACWLLDGINLLLE